MVWDSSLLFFCIQHQSTKTYCAKSNKTKITQSEAAISGTLSWQFSSFQPKYNRFSKVIYNTDIIVFLNYFHILLIIFIAKFRTSSKLYTFMCLSDKVSLMRM
jgi:hypothetical protein